MLKIGQYNSLKILRDTGVGLYLGQNDEDPDAVLLPNKYVPRLFEIGQEVDVFVYLDHEERPVATTLEPYIYVDEFGLLRVNHVNNFGAFLDWGLEKDIFVPFKEQARPMEKGQRYLIYLYFDEQSKRLVGSSKTNQFLKKDNIELERGEEVELLISHISDAGINVIINETYKGLLYQDEVFNESIRAGDRIRGFVKNIRDDGKIDVALNPLGYAKVEENAQRILDELEGHNGFLKLQDKSSPDDIKTILQMSKKTFKQCIGSLYKEKLIEIKDDGIYLTKSE